MPTSSLKPRITFEHVTKEYVLRDDRTFKEVLPSLILGKGWAKKVEVLQDLSFTFEQGSTVGIVGRNGAGKSTILKMIAGVTYPKSGKITVQGAVAPLIEVGAGFHQELTGYENIFLNGAILGMSKPEIAERVEDIIRFSGLEEYIHQPVKRYSSGMYMRLGFSVAVHTKAPILLIDEVLAVGDIEFQRKCLKRLTEMKETGQKIIVFVSHDEEAVKSFCERTLLIDEHRIVADGKPSKVLDAYHQRIEQAL